MSVTLTVPQWSVGTTLSLFQLSNTTWTNAAMLTNDPYFGSMFSNTSNTIFLTSNYTQSSTPGTQFILQDTASNAYPFTLIVSPPTYTVSGGGTVFQYDAITNLPITFTAPTSISAILTVPSTLIPGPRLVIPRTISALFSSYNIAPSLPTGLGSSIDVCGNVSIAGTPSSLRSQTSYTMYARTSDSKTIASVFSLQVVGGRYQFSNISGTVVTNTVATATLKYKASNNIVVGVRGLAGTLLYDNLPVGMTIGYSGTQIDLSGVPTQFVDLSYRVTITNPKYTTPLTYSITMTPCLEIIVPTTAIAYSNIPYTASSPIFYANVQGYPAACNSYFLSSAGTGLSIAQSGAVFGTISSTRSIVIDASGYNTLRNTSTVTVSTIPDVVTFSAPTTSSFSLTQNVPFDLQCTANAQSGQPLVYSISPLLDGPIGATLDASTGRITGTPRAVSSQTNYSVIAATPQGVSVSKSITLTTQPDYISISSYGLNAYCSPSTKYLPLISERAILQLEYSNVSLGFVSSTYSGDPIIAYLYSGFPSGVTLTEQGVLTGMPLVAGNYTGSVIVRSLNGITATLSLQFAIASNVLMLTSPATTNFVRSVPSSPDVYQVSGIASSGTSILSYGLSGAPAGVTITSAGNLVISSSSQSSPVQFDITAATAQAVLSTRAVLTVNDSRSGTFISPPGSILLPSGSYPIITSTPGYTFSLSGSTDVAISGLNLVRTNAVAIYPPQMIYISAIGGSSPFYNAVNVATASIVPYTGESYRWTQYVPISTLTLSAVSAGLPIVFSIPNPPPGTRWNPVDSTLNGGPNSLTIQDTFVAYAGDGITTVPFSFVYSVVAPVYIRLFSAPSAYTNFVKQTAFIKAAVHAIDNTAFLPDPLIASQTGPYPIDETTSTICARREPNRSSQTPSAPSGAVSILGGSGSGVNSLYSYDGITYYRGNTTAPAMSIMPTITRAGNIWTGGGMFSYNGIDWFFQILKFDTSRYQVYRRGPFWNGTIFVQGLTTGIPGIPLAYSVDGILWNLCGTTDGNVPSSGIMNTESILQVGGTFVAGVLANDTTKEYRILNSSDGITWYRVGVLINGEIAGVTGELTWLLASNGTVLVAATYRINSHVGSIQYSTNFGATWAVAATIASPVSLEYSFGAFVLSTDTSVLYSLDGIVWAGVPTISGITVVAASDSMFLALYAEANQVFTSTNGTVWSTLPSTPVPAESYSLSWNSANKMWIRTDVNGVKIYYSYNGTVWSPAVLP